MRILTIQQPWAWAILHGGKTVENRKTNVAGSYRGPIALHAGLAFDDEAFTSVVLHDAWTNAGRDDAPGGWGTAHRGLILGVVDLIDVHQTVMTDRREHCTTVAPPTEPNMAGACSRWADSGRFHLVLANPRPLPDPIPFKGALGLRHLDPEVVARIEAQLTAFRPDIVNTIVTERLS